MLHNYEVAFVLVWNTEIVEESFGGLSHHHGAEELASEPGTASGGDAGFDDGNLQVGTLLAEHVGSAKTARSSTDDDDVGFGVVVQVGKVATG